MNPVKHIIIAVTNDLYTDQRAHRVANSLAKRGVLVTLVGRHLAYSSSLPSRAYKTLRFKLLFKKGFLFYACYNLRLFFYLLFSKVDIIVSNDLDTLTACFFASKLRGVAIVYDSHELYTEVPELINRRIVRSIWLLIERMLLPGIKYCYTVNESIAEIYRTKYKIPMEVIRNFPLKSVNNEPYMAISFPGKRIILYQGALNVSRGIEMAIDAMQFIESSILVIIGEGDLSQQLRQRASDLNLAAKVKFLGRIPFDQLFAYTSSADLGLSLEENAGQSYYYALPNKLFDYIQARVPIIASDFPEISAIIYAYDIGSTISNRSPLALAGLIDSIFTETSRYNHWKSNLERAREELCWENEEPKLLSIYRKLGLNV